tara:strand:+ start:222 stop:347 length:126 start_codon:yes stop_codon:yes gene_type:complete
MISILNKKNKVEQNRYSLIFNIQQIENRFNFDKKWKKLNVK